MTRIEAALTAAPRPYFTNDDIAEVTEVTDYRCVTESGNAYVVAADNDNKVRISRTRGSASLESNEDDIVVDLAVVVTRRNGRKRLAALVEAMPGVYVRTLITSHIA